MRHSLKLFPRLLLATLTLYIAGPVRGREQPKREEIKIADGATE